MIREIVKIDEELCDGCANCIPNCDEGALQMIDGKARLVSDLMCDGLGACLGHCPHGAISIEKREAEAYDEIQVIKEMVAKGANTVVAHLSHMKEHNEMEYLGQGVKYLKDHEKDLGFDLREVLSRVHNSHVEKEQLACGCSGSEARSFAPQSAAPAAAAGLAGGLSLGHAAAPVQSSELRQWPVQMHLINPSASYFQGSDMVLAADCVAFSLGNFHSHWLKGKTLGIACPKLDQGLESYMEKIQALIDEAKINTLTVMMMQVPCCTGLLQLAKTAAARAERKIPVKSVIVSAEGEILREDWI